MKSLSILLTLIGFSASSQAALLITTGEIIDITGTIKTIVPTSHTTLNNMTRSGNVFTIDNPPASVDHYISYTTQNIDPDAYRYLQIDFANLTVTNNHTFQLYLSDDNIYAGADLAGNFANAITPPISGNFSILLDLNNGTNLGGWVSSQNGNPLTGNDIDAIRLDVFNSLGFDGASFEITGITFGTSIINPIPEPTSVLLGGLGLLGLLRRRR